ncbi:ComEC/Rec2 family competence protein [Sulfurihydrogenibium subterraneum]|uniref:ComEC/Rec2 family competence protein n=1 Tax=Sulfurihydrogenibium subterraneum TaxID=171121 RepID=UPI00048F6319|nr:ComEC/Rec2 family competence protein [Sulfurihydrogenibium subterraneum]
MIYPWLTPLIILVVGIVLNQKFNFSIHIVIPVLIFILSFSFKGIFRYIILNVGILLLAFSVSYKEKINTFEIKTPSFFECKVVSFPSEYRTSKSFDCKVISSDYQELKGKTIKVYSKEEDVYFLTRLAFFGKGKVEDGEVKVSTIKNFVIVDNSDNPLYSFFKLKESLINNYGLHRLNNETFSVGTALIFGEKKYLDYGTYKPFLETGLAHLIAISGSHIAILFFSLNFILFFFSERVRYLVLASLLPFYTVFTGFGIPVVRAVFMALIFILSKLLYLKNNPLNILFFTAFIFLLINPDSLFSVSFQLSFVAVLGIILSVEVLKDYNNLVKLLGVSLFATLFTAPIVLYYFYNFSPTTIIATPIASLPLYPLLTLSVFNIFTGFNLDFLVKFMDFFGLIFIEIVKFFSKLGFYHTGFSPSVWVISLYFVVILAVLNLKIRAVEKVLISCFAFIVFLFLSKSDLRPKIYTIKTKVYPVVFVAKEGSCYLFTDFEYSKALNLLRKEGCKSSYLLTEKPEKFSDDFILNFDRIITYTYQVSVDNILFKKWVEPYLLINGKEYFLKNDDRVIFLD